MIYDGKVGQLQTRSFPISIAGNHDHHGNRNDVKIEIGNVSVYNDRKEILVVKCFKTASCYEYSKAPLLIFIDNDHL